MKVRFTQSARRHRIGRAHVLYVIENYEAQHYEKNEKLYAYWSSLDERGLEIEIVAVVEENSLTVIHVMPANFRRGARKWRE